MHRSAGRRGSRPNVGGEFRYVPRTPALSGSTESSPAVKSLISTYDKSQGPKELPTRGDGVGSGAKPLNEAGALHDAGKLIGKKMLGDAGTALDVAAYCAKYPLVCAVPLVGYTAYELIVAPEAGPVDPPGGKCELPEPTAPAPEGTNDSAATTEPNGNSECALQSLVGCT